MMIINEWNKMNESKNVPIAAEVAWSFTATLLRERLRKTKANKEAEKEAKITMISIGVNIFFRRQYKL
jgi:hypothetical protein